MFQDDEFNLRWHLKEEVFFSGLRKLTVQLCPQFYAFKINACMRAPHAYRCPLQPEASVQSPGTGVTGGCSQSRECWELNSGPLKE